jgi:hypothetical protein
MCIYIYIYIYIFTNIYIYIPISHAKHDTEFVGGRGGGRDQD